MGQRFCVSDKPPGDADVAAGKTHYESQHLGALVLTLQWASQSAGVLTHEHRHCALLLVLDSIGLGWGLGMCISNNFAGFPALDMIMCGGALKLATSGKLTKHSQARHLHPSPLPHLHGPHSQGLIGQMRT